MQRSKIKVGSDYAVSSFREWWKRNLTAVQVLDTGAWHHLNHWDKGGKEEAPDTVPEPHRPANETVAVPGHIRRGESRLSRDRNTVLVRNFTEKADGTRTYGTPYMAATRHLVAPLEEAQEQREEYRTRSLAEAKVAREKREAAASEEEQFNTRLARWGAGPVGRNYYSGDRYVLDAATLEMLLTLAERSVEGTREFEPES